MYNEFTPERITCGITLRYERELSFWRNVVWFKVNGSGFTVPRKAKRQSRAHGECMAIE